MASIKAESNSRLYKSLGFILNQSSFSQHLSFEHIIPPLFLANLPRRCDRHWSLGWKQSKGCGTRRLREVILVDNCQEQPAHPTPHNSKLISYLCPWKADVGELTRSELLGCITSTEADEKCWNLQVRPHLRQFDGWDCSAFDVMNGRTEPTYRSSDEPALCPSHHTRIFTVTHKLETLWINNIKEFRSWKWHR